MTEQIPPPQPAGMVVLANPQRHLVTLSDERNSRQTLVYRRSK